MWRCRDHTCIFYCVAWHCSFREKIECRVLSVATLDTKFWCRDSQWCLSLWLLCYLMNRTNFIPQEYTFNSQKYSEGRLIMWLVWFSALHCTEHGRIRMFLFFPISLPYSSSFLMFEIVVKMHSLCFLIFSDIWLMIQVFIKSLFLISIIPSLFWSHCRYNISCFGAYLSTSVVELDWKLFDYHEVVSTIEMSDREYPWNLPDYLRSKQIHFLYKLSCREYCHPWLWNSVTMTEVLVAKGPAITGMRT